MKVQVLGSGCPTCQRMFTLVQQVVSNMDQDIDLEYVTGLEGTKRIIELGAMSSPVLVVDNTVAMVGFTPDPTKIQTAITKHAAGE